MMGIKTALDLSKYSPVAIRDSFSIVLERTVRELNGESCLDLEELPPTKQQIMCSRSFGRRITTFEQMSEAIAQYTARAAEKLRQENQQAKMLTVFVQTSQFKESQKTYSNSATGELILPGSDTRELNVLAMQLLKRVWREGYSYSKGGVMLSDFYDNNAYQPGLFDDVEKRPNSTKLMSVLDEINQSGLGKVFLARQGIQNTWQMKREHLSPAYTTRWADLPKVN